LRIQDYCRINLVDADLLGNFRGKKATFKLIIANALTKDKLIIAYDYIYVMKFTE
jgi:hypothetical protein